MWVERESEPCVGVPYPTDWIDSEATRFPLADDSASATCLYDRFECLITRPMHCDLDEWVLRIARGGLCLQPALCGLIAFILSAECLLEDALA